LVTNLFNRKVLYGGALKDPTGTYLQYVWSLRQNGSNVKYGDPSTFHVFTEPYLDTNGNWHAPISPSTDWLMNVNPRQYRLGVQVSL
jgi:hypothetical protein